MKKVAILLPGIEKIGGAERQAIQLAGGLATRGWKVYLLCMSGGIRGQHDELRAVECHSLQMRHGWKDPIGWLRLSRWIRRHQPDILHAHLPHATWMARWSRLFTPVRVVCDTLHTASTGNFLRRTGYRLSDRLSNGTTAVSGSVAKCWIGQCGVKPEKLTLLPNGVKIPAMRVARHPSALPFHWLAVGRLEAVKDYGTMLQAFALANRNARLTIAGEGAMRGRLQALAATLGVAGRVEWAGFLADLSPLYSQADGLVLSSRWEGLPMSILEASSHGLPVVATDAAGVRDALPQDSHAWIAPVGDAAALAEKMSSMMERSATERAQIGDENFNFAEEHFAMEKLLDAWERTYEQLLALNPAPHRWG